MNISITNNISRSRNAQKLFNLRYTFLRNVIKRIFGIVKKKFRIFDKTPEYSPQNQVLFILALTELHNYIREAEDTTNYEFESNLDVNMNDLEDSVRPIQNSGSFVINSLRNQIANDI